MPALPASTPTIHVQVGKIILLPHVRHEIQLGRVGFRLDHAAFLSLATLGQSGVLLVAIALAVGGGIFSLGLGAGSGAAAGGTTALARRDLGRDGGPSSRRRAASLFGGRCALCIHPLGRGDGLDRICSWGWG